MSKCFYLCQMYLVAHVSDIVPVLLLPICHVIFLANTFILSYLLLRVGLSQQTPSLVHCVHVLVYSHIQEPQNSA
jgi:hypothetical protein